MNKDTTIHMNVTNKKHAHFTFEVHKPNVSQYLLMSLSYSVLDVAISNLNNPAGWMVHTTGLLKI